MLVGFVLYRGGFELFAVALFELEMQHLFVWPLALDQRRKYLSQGHILADKLWTRGGTRGSIGGGSCRAQGGALDGKACGRQQGANYSFVHFITFKYYK